jgi:iron complex outermembrane receptor protein
MQRVLDFAPKILASLLLTVPVLAAANDADFDFEDFDLKELTSLEVTSVSKRAEKLSDTASAIHVITAEDIRRSGFTSVPEALRLVPGMGVERINSSTWAISARGFEDDLAGKLLVLVDGRSVYTTLFAGTFWDIQTPPMADIERIEVIRGPGSTLWGANAVNGVINIITKKTQVTKGSRMAVRAGNEEQLTTELRHGLALGEHATARISGMTSHMDPQSSRTGHASYDDYSMNQLHSRLDWNPSERDDVSMAFGWYNSDAGRSSLTFLPDYSDNAGTLVEGSEETRGTHGRFAWGHEISDRNSIELSGYFDRTGRHTDTFRFAERALDLGFQQNLSIGDRNQVVWGLGWRRTDSSFDGSTTIFLSKPDEALVNYSFFAQDEIALTDALRLIAGSKVSWNDYTGWEIQPTVRTFWNVADGHGVWAAISRSVRTPARKDRFINNVLFSIPLGPGFNLPVTVRGNEDFESEIQVSYELGYRAEVSERLTLDAAVFASDYENLEGLDQTLLQLNNTNEERSQGAELGFHWLPLSRTKVSGSWTTIHLHRSERSPAHQWQLHTAFDLAYGFELDLGVYYRGRRLLTNATTGLDERIGSHTRTDIRLGWKARPDLTFAIVGQDLFDRQHRENNFRGILPVSEIERSVFFQATYGF